ncbi:ABC transporter permease [Flavitalea sp. BT771]|uniref:ABC transporter permease n=1 Tax=Flavitalea sp. BT771 TaxID=3063329 RepID=UPI0026E27EF1|nr:ABC transporter permease [Flavitalea sp. BT771]MDO6430372.1 ABC transporter permease [Flavitalea sp. BT771]MDV6219488.1 ABC transporter permease [Flavitalea sp. BT771]
MLKSYFTIAVRHLARHRLFSAIMVTCLAVGITFSMIIGLYVRNQEKVNSTVHDVGNQYMIRSNWKVKGLGLDITTVAPLAKTMKEEYPDLVAGYYRYNPVGTVISAGDSHDRFFKENVAICDTTLVAVYGFPLLYGDKGNAFPTISSAVITERIAMKWFGAKDVVGRTFEMQTTGAGETQQYTISAVLKDLPDNSVTSLMGNRYDIFVPTIGSRFYAGGDPSTNWGGAYEVGLLELKPGVKPGDLQAPFRRVLAKYTKDPITKNLEVELAPLQDYHLKENNGAVQRMVMTLALIAAFILLMAIINFVNITIGTSAYRLREIGLRKVFGSARQQLVLQFIIEAWLLTLLAAVISVGLYQLLIPVFDQVLNTRLTSVADFSFADIGLLLSGVVVVGFLAGIYPAFILSRYAVVNSVKGKVGAVNGAGGLRKTLLVVQLSLAICVFISTLNVSKQVAYVFSKDLGYDKEQLLVIDAFPKQWDSAGVARMESIKSGLLQLPAVKAASLSFEVPDRTPPATFDLMSLAGAGNRRLPVEMIMADQDFAITFGLKVTEGSFFSASSSYMPGQVVVNESAAKALGLTLGKAAGAILRLPDGRGQVTVTGVVKDFHYAGMQQAIAPLVFLHVKDTKNYRYLTVKLHSPDISQVVSQVKAKWKELSPHAPFGFSFMDDRFEALYRADLQLKKAAGVATGLNLLIVFLGIFGIVAFTLTRRNKEMAVRKVLGAGLVDIIRLFLQDYAGLILLANLISWPLAYAITDKWLENYAYRITQDIFPYISVGAIIFVTAFGLITVQCLKTAMANPVKSLRTDG